MTETATRVSPGLKRLLYWEMVIVLGLSLGRSAVYSILSIIDKLTIPNRPLKAQVTQLNASAAPDRPWLDLSYQILGLVFPLVPVLLAFYLLTVFNRTGQLSPARAMGFDFKRPWFDLGWGFAILAGIGIPGILFYFLTRELGVNTTVSPTNLSEHWWTIPVLVGSAIMNGVLEEVLMLGYLFTRWFQTGGRAWTIVVISAFVRGLYHLYQGFGGFAGNLVMGLAFGWLYLRFKRVGPLVVAHFLLDLFAFVGYSLLSPYLSWL